MTTLGDDIRAQQRVADRLSGDLTRCASSQRTQIVATDWTSSAATHCRARLEALANSIDALGAAATALARSIDAHAASVEAQEAAQAVVPTPVSVGVMAPPPKPPTCVVQAPREPQLMFPALSMPRGAR